MPKNPPLIHIEGLNVTYFPGRSNEVRALKNISLEIFDGEFIIFFGPSGCGKSTLLYSIAGLERNVEGKIVVKGRDLAAMRLNELESYHQSTIGMIFQSFYLIPSLSVLQNVALPQMAFKSPTAERNTKAQQLLDKFGVGQHAKNLPTELSGGQQQRVALCRSLINDPDVLIADEPVGNLDSKSSQDVMALLRHLNDKDKRTVILVTHDPSHLRHAHRIFYLRDGTITGTKTNTKEEREEAANLTPLSAATMSHWAKAYAPTTYESQEAAALAMRAQRIAADVLTGLTADEVEEVESMLQAFLQTNPNEQRIVEFLRMTAKDGGIGMNEQKAKRLARELATFVEQIHQAEKAAKENKEENVTLTAAEAQEVRRMLLEELDVHLKGLTAVASMDESIRLRLEAAISREELQHRLDLEIDKGGAGLDARVARLIARKVEPFITYRPENTPSTPPPPHEDV